MRILPLVLALALLGCAGEPPAAEAPAAEAMPADLPVDGIGHVAYYSSDLDATADFYTGILGYQEAFRFPAADGQPESVFFKVNDRQFLRFDKTESPAPDIRFIEVAFLTPDIEALRQSLVDRGLEPTPFEERRDGNRYTSLTDPEGHRISFVEYAPGSKQKATDGQLLVRERLSTEVWHTGVRVKDQSKMDAFFHDKLGFWAYWTGARDGQNLYVHNHAPGLRDNFYEYLLEYGESDRERLGSMYHIALKVDDLDNVLEKAHARGLPRDERHAARLGMVKHWLANLFDPDGTRIEFMEPHFVY